MLRIPCPHCGVRDHNEFMYLGDATVQRPTDITPGKPWLDYVYYRTNPRGNHAELWHHSHGCRAWLVVTRDTVSHEIFGAKLAREWAP